MLERRNPVTAHWLSVCALAALFLCTGALAETMVGRVVAVADGDTLTVLDSSSRQHRIRLSGIDAPESGQPFGRRSKQSLSSMVYGKRVSVEWHKADRYGRILGKVLFEGTDVNRAQILAGMAWYYRQYAKELPLVDRVSYAVTESDARKARAGLWADDLPVAPWQWRRESKSNGGGN